MSEERKKTESNQQRIVAKKKAGNIKESKTVGNGSGLQCGSGWSSWEKIVRGEKEGNIKESNWEDWLKVMARAYTVAVIGAGMIGSSAARWAARAQQATCQWDFNLDEPQSGNSL